MILRLALTGLAVVLAIALIPGVGAADPSSPAVEERRQPPPVADAGREYDRGLRARVA